MSLVERRLNQAYRNSSVIPFHSGSKFIIMSDCHRGQGNAGDNFLPNQNLFFGALEYYFQNGFIYIEVGDGDELWENRRMEPIIQVHSDAFWMMSNFYRENRFYMLYGNHDVAKKKKGITANACENYYSDEKKCQIPLFPGIVMREGLILENTETRARIFLVHGHQGDIMNDLFWPLARFMVRYIWRTMELVGFLDPTGAGRTHKKKEKIEKRLLAYGNDNEEIVIAGHTHRPYFSKPGQGYYFNDGSCVHPRCITGIEIENNQISLVKWAVCTREDRTLFVCREVLEGPVSLNEYMC